MEISEQFQDYLGHNIWIILELQVILGKPSKNKSGEIWEIVLSSLPPTHPIEVGTHMRKKFRWPNVSNFNMTISNTVWTMSLILSHPPTLLGQCPKFDRIYFLMASLMNQFFLNTCCIHHMKLFDHCFPHVICSFHHLVQHLPSFHYLVRCFKVIITLNYLLRITIIVS